MRAAVVLTAVMVVCMTASLTIGLDRAGSHLAYKPAGMSLKQREATQTSNLAHVRYVCRNGAGKHRRWACRATVWIGRELRETQNLLRPVTHPTVARMIAAAVQVKRESPGSDPWPNCPDPYDGGGSWQATKDCESPGWSWLDDPPGYYCGPLQLDPVIWEHVVKRYGVPC